MPVQVCRPKHAYIRCLADRAHRGQRKPDQWIHIPEAGCLGNEQALRCKQGVNARQCARQVANQMEKIESQNRVKRRRVRRKRLCGRGAKDKGRERAGGVSLLSNRDHAGGNIGRKIALNIAREPERCCSCSAAQFQHPVARSQQGAGPLQRTLISGLIRNRTLGVLP
jgi:hypothetical protein